jgi:hypothetical protein
VIQPRKLAALQGQRPQSGDGSHRALEYGLLERATGALRGHGHLVDDTLLQYLSPGLGTHQPDRRLYVAQQR